jgi:streptogramin lyase
VLSEFSEGLAGIPYDIAPGADGAMWFSAAAPDAIGRVTAGGLISEFSAGLEGHEPERIALGPDGDMWFSVENAPTFNSLGWITPAGEITVIPPAELMAGSRPHGLAAGPEGNVWFTDGGVGVAAIGRVTPCGPAHCTPKPEEFTSGLPPGSDPESIVAGPDGNLWFTDVTARAIGRVVPCAAPCTPTIEEFSLGAGTGPNAIATGPDGKVWFTDAGPTRRIGQIVPCSPAPGCTPTITESADGLSAGTEPWGIAPGADGNMWFTDKGTPRAIGRIGTGAPAALQSSPAIAGGGLVGATQTCAGATWSTWAGVQPSASLLSVDGYGWQLDGAAIASGQTYTPTAAQVGHSLTCSETVTYPLPLFVTAPVATSAPATVASVPSTEVAPPRALPPRITALRQSASRWRKGRKLARISARRMPPVGTTFSFLLSERASLRLAFVRHAPGRRVAGRCVAKTRRNAKRRACRRTLGGAISLVGHAGSDRVFFQGRLSSHKALSLGGYTMTIFAINSAGLRSAPRSLRFTIVK